MNLKKNGKVFTSKFVGTGPSYKKRIYRTAVSQRLRKAALEMAKQEACRISPSVLLRYMCSVGAWDSVVVKALRY